MLWSTGQFRNKQRIKPSVRDVRSSVGLLVSPPGRSGRRLIRVSGIALITVLIGVSVSSPMGSSLAYVCIPSAVLTATSLMAFEFQWYILAGIALSTSLLLLISCPAH